MTAPLRQSWLNTVVGLVFVLGVAGCQPTALDPDKYGEIMNEAPRVPGADKPYPLPQLEESPEPEPEK